MAKYPTKLVNRHGYHYDGGDYLRIPSTGIFNTAEVGIVVEFTPDFDTDINAHKFLFDSSSWNRYFIDKYPNASGNVLGIYIGNSPVFSIAEAVYKPHWRKNQRNIIIVSGKSGANSVWLNNYLIATNASAWVPRNPVELVIGAYYGYVLNFTGKIHSFQVYQKLITPIHVFDIQQSISKKVNQE